MKTINKTLKQIMEDRHITAAQLSRQTGFSKAAISQYLSGTNYPSEERIIKLATVLNCSVTDLIDPQTDPAFSTEKITLTCDEAARLMHKHPDYVREGLKQGRPGFEFGTAVKTSDRWSFCIYRKRFEEITGIPVRG